MYNLILLDADGTIFDYDKAEEYALKETLLKIKFEGDLKKARERYRKINFSLWRELEKETITKDKLKTERFKRLFDKYGLNYDAEELSNYYLIKLGECGYLLKGAEEICKYLSKKYTLVILTNGIKDVQLSRLEKSPIKNYISDIIISEEVGASKPNPYIFEYTLKKLKHSNKDDVIIIGDSLTSDIQGGINFGIDTCWLNLNGIENKTKIRPKYCIKTLKELTNIL